MGPWPGLGENQASEEVEPKWLWTESLENEWQGEGAAVPRGAWIWRKPGAVMKSRLSLVRVGGEARGSGPAPQRLSNREKKQHAVLRLLANSVRMELCLLVPGEEGRRAPQGSQGSGTEGGARTWPGVLGSWDCWDRETQTGKTSTRASDSVTLLQAGSQEPRS